MQDNRRKKKLNNIKKKLSKAESLLINSDILRQRSELLSRLGKSFGTNRDIYDALGYNKNPTFDDYYSRYKRQDIARCVIDRPVKDSWVQAPTISEGSDEDETEFEKAWNDLVKQKKIYYYFPRLDKLCGIGQFALLLIGTNDGKKLNEPLVSASELIYLQTYKQSDVNIQEWDKNINSPRYGLPNMYSVRISNAEHKGHTSQLVHYTRVIHVADNCLDNDVIGDSRLEEILNRLQDLDLVVGSGAEMFYQGAFQGLAFMLKDDAQLDPDQDMSDLETEIYNYVHKFQRYLRLQGMEVQPLGGTVADPRGHVDVILDLIAGAKEIPKRILIGSERGELASSQDADSWFQKISERQTNFCEPIILRPFIDKLIEVGILPEPKEEYQVEWPDRLTPSDDQKAVTAQVKTATLATYVNSLGADQVVPVEIFLEKWLGFSKEEIEEIQNVLGGSFDDLREEDKLEQEEIKNKEIEEENKNAV